MEDHLIISVISSETCYKIIRRINETGLREDLQVKMVKINHLKQSEKYNLKIYCNWVNPAHSYFYLGRLTNDINQI